jgi:hypothetical protein
MQILSDYVNCLVCCYFGVEDPFGIALSSISLHIYYNFLVMKWAKPNNGHMVFN